MHQEAYTGPRESQGPRGEPPRELRRRPAWMGSRVRRLPNGKLDKPPYRVRDGEPVAKASYTDPANHATYAQALDALERGDVNAIGFVFTEADPFFCLDLDAAIDPETGEADATALRVVHAFDCYTELSISGTGLHAVARGKKPEGAGCKSGALGRDVELYDRSRFVVITGERLGGADPEAPLPDRQQQLDELCRELWPPSSSSGAGPSSASGLQDGGSFAREPVDLEDLELLERARKAKNGAKFRALYDHGDRDAHKGKDRSASGADCALINMLIFWTRGDRDRVVDLFERSALYRPPTERDRGYVARSVDGALGSYKGGFYHPRSRKRIAEQEPEAPDPLAPYLELLLDPSRWRGKRGATAYKVYAASVIVGAERGVFDDSGNLRIGCDTRTLAEVAGVGQNTVCNSALPYLLTELNLLRWERSPRKTGVFVLKKPESAPSRVSKERGLFTDSSQRALETLGLLIRMRSGRSEHKPLKRLGVVAMFALVPIVSPPRRGLTLEELADATGRRARDLRRHMTHLKQAGVVREDGDGRYRPTAEFRERYERELERTGITYSERQQKRRHAKQRERDRHKRDAIKRSDPPLRGAAEMQRVLAERDAETRERELEEQRRKVGVTAAVFVGGEADGGGVRYAELRERWRARGGRTAHLQRAIREGPWVFRREPGDFDRLYVYPSGSSAGGA